MIAGRRPTIGLVVNDTSAAYQIAISNGVREACEESGVGFLCYVVGEMASPNHWASANRELLRLIHPGQVDGIAIVSPVFANWQNGMEVEEFFRGFAGLPIVSIGAAVPGYPSVVTDNLSGMEQVVDHLVEVHGIREPLFISGAPESPDSTQRLDGFRRVLGGRGIAWDASRRCLCGEWSGLGGRTAMRKFMETGITFDAVVAANDYMAIGAMQAMRDIGMRVPEDVVVTGFDDTEEASKVSPTLSSVRQPMRIQGRRAVEILLDMLDGSPPTQMVEVVPAEFFPRFSCGCRSRETQEARDLEPTSSLGEPETDPNSGAYHRLLAVAPTGLRAGDPERILRCLKTESLTGAVNETLAAVDGHIRQVVDAGQNPWQIQSYLTHLRKEAHRHWARDANRLLRLETLLHLARMEVASSCIQLQTQERVFNESRVRSFTEFAASLVNSFDLNVLVRVLSEGLASLCIRNAYLVIHESDSSEAGNRMLFALEDGVQLPLPEGGQLLEDSEIFPPAIQARIPRKELVVEQLAFLGEHLGHILLEMRPDLAMLYDPLRIQLSAALAGYNLMRQVRASKEETQKAYDSLRHNQQQLLVSEKMASLGKLTAGIAHEMNTPLSAMRSSLEEIKRLGQEYRESIGDPTVLEEDHRQIAAEILKAVDVATRAGDKAGDFVRSIRTHTRDMDSKERKVFDAAAFLEETSILLEHAARRAGIDLRLQISSRPLPLFGIPERLAHALVNIATNGMEACLGRSGGRVDLRIRSEDAGVVIEIEDNGCGIDPAVQSRIFDPLFTTKPVGKGTGLGLTVAHDIVQSDMEGKIAFRTEPGRGTVFMLEFPRAFREEDG